MKYNATKDYSAFVRAGGGKSGVYDTSDSGVKNFVKEYKQFISKKDIYTRDKNGSLIPKYRKYRKEHNHWVKQFNNRNK